MNKYASGYTLLQLFFVIGWVVIAASLIGGLIIFTSLPDGMRMFGVVVAISGIFQGLILLGAASIGSAVLDGSVAQQIVASKIDSALNADIEKYRAMQFKNIENREFQADQVRIKSYKGYAINKSSSGIHIFGIDGVFKNVIAAERYIDDLPSS